MTQHPHEHPAPPRGDGHLPWHLRKAFLLPVVAVLLLGALSSAVLLVAATVTYVRVSAAVDHLQGELRGLGLVADDTASTWTGTGGAAGSSPG